MLCRTEILENLTKCLPTLRPDLISTEVIGWELSSTCEWKWRDLIGVWNQLYGSGIALINIEASTSPSCPREESIAVSCGVSLWSESMVSTNLKKKNQNYLRLIPNLNSVGENSKQALLMCLFSNTKVTETQIVGEMGWWRYRQVLSFLRCPYPHWGRKWGHPIYLHLLIPWKGHDNNHASDLKKENN